MKLAFICTELLPCPSIRGGAIQIMIDGIAPLLKQQHELTIFSVADPKLPNHEVRDGIEYVRVPRKTYVSGIKQELAKRRFDLIHVFNRPKPVPEYKQAAPKSAFVVSLHNDMMKEEKISEIGGRKTIRAVKKIMTVSDYIGRVVLRRFPQAKKKLITVYSGADLSAYQPVWSPRAREIRESLFSRYGLSGKKVILFVGRLSEKKGPDLLIKAMPHVLKKHPDAVLMITGGKWFSDESVNDYVQSLHRLAKPLKDKVVFANFIPTHKIPEHYLMGDVFVCSSQWQEPLARVHYEAMAAGLPVITTDRGGNAEIIKNGFNGIVIKRYKDPLAFAEAINQLLSDPKKALQLAKNGRRMVESNFGIHHVANRLNHVYMEALGLPEPEPIKPTGGFVIEQVGSDTKLDRDSG
jgi:glycosyltransferase involved in cell wall biosynthesis